MRSKPSTLLTLVGLVHVDVGIKVCVKCRRRIDYKESTLGVFNYDNRLLVSHALLRSWYDFIDCSRTGIGEVVGGYMKRHRFDVLGIKPIDVTYAFMSALALKRDVQSDMICLLCGPCPRVRVLPVIGSRNLTHVISFRTVAGSDV
jgi:hypothetical protein